MRIAIVGGTGKEGKGLALRWARAGHRVAIGSRDAERAREKAAELGEGVSGGGNVEVVADAELVVLAIPYTAHGDTLRSLCDALNGKIVVDITVPLQPPKVSVVHLPPGRAAALEAQEILGPGAKVIAALHHVSSVHLGDPSHALECDVLVCGDDVAAREQVIALISELGTRAFDAGPLANAVALESLTPVLLHMNKRYKTSGIGVRFTGVP